MRHGEAGFTLVEVIVATVLLAVGVLAVASAAATSARLVADGTHATERAIILRNEAEARLTAACEGSGEGGISRGRSRVSWSTARGEGVSEVLVRVVEMARVDARVESLRTAVACAP